MSVIRWTIGPVSKWGFEILNESVRCFKKNYPEVRRFVCFNNISKDKLNKLSNLDVELINQNDYANSLSFPPKGPAWPLYPPRLFINEHEMFVDNDVVIYNRVSEIDQFLVSNEMSFFSEGTKRRYGNYDYLIPQGLKINSGLFGLCPNFDFASKIELLLKSNIKDYHDHHHDFQGIVAGCLHNCLTTQIKMSTITLCEPNQDISYGSSGIHFVVANQCKDIFHKAWEQYKALRMIL